MPIIHSATPIYPSSPRFTAPCHMCGSKLPSEALLAVEGKPSTFRCRECDCWLKDAMAHFEANCGLAHDWALAAADYPNAAARLRFAATYRLLAARWARLIRQKESYPHG